MKLPEDQVQYIDRFDVSETFVNSLGNWIFSDGVANIELCVTRLNKPEPPNPPSGKKYPVCRLVLTPQLVIELFQSLNSILGAMKDKGLIKQIPQPDETRH